VSIVAFYDGNVDWRVDYHNNGSGTCAFLGYKVVWQDCDGLSHTTAEIYQFNVGVGGDVSWLFTKDCGGPANTLRANIPHVLFRDAGYGAYGVTVFNPTQGLGHDWNTQYDSGSCLIQSGGNCAPYAPWNVIDQ
jgi:hypothetical protein